MTNLTEFTDLEFEKKYELIETQLKEGKVPSKNPKAYLLGGQAGAGKSSLHKIIEDETARNVITIDNDQFKKYHPRYKKLEKMYGTEVTKLVTPFSNKMTEELIKRLSNENYNLTIEGTLRTVETPLKTNEQLKSKGYSTSLYVVGTEKELSYLSTLERYEEMTILNPVTARATPKEIHDEIVNKIANNLDIIYSGKEFGEIKVLTREGQSLYSMHETPSESPKDILQAKIDNPLTDQQRIEISMRLAEKLETIKEQGIPENQTLREIETEIKHSTNHKELSSEKVTLKQKIENAKTRQQKLNQTQNKTKNRNNQKHL